MWVYLAAHGDYLYIVYLCGLVGGGSLGLTGFFMEGRGCRYRGFKQSERSTKYTTLRGLIWQYMVLVYSTKDERMLNASLLLE
jgi:hypothetical protein